MMMESAPNSFFSSFHPPGFYQNFPPSGNTSMGHNNPPMMFGSLSGNGSMLPPSGPSPSSAFSGFSSDVIGRRSFVPSSHHHHPSFSNPPPSTPFFNGWSSSSYGNSGSTFMGMQHNPPSGPSSGHMGLLTSSDPILIIPSTVPTTSPTPPPFFSRPSKLQHTRLSPINSSLDNNNSNNTNNSINNNDMSSNNNNLNNNNSNNNNQDVESKLEVSKLDELGLTMPTTSTSTPYFNYHQKYNHTNNSYNNIDNNNNHQQQPSHSICNGFSPYQSPLKSTNLSSPGSLHPNNNHNNSSNLPLNHYNNPNNNSFTNNLLNNNNLKASSTLGYSPFSSSDILNNQTPFVPPHQHPLNQLSNLYVGDMYPNHPPHPHHHHHLPPVSSRLFSSELASLPLPSRIDPGHMGYLNDLASQTAVG